MSIVYQFHTTTGVTAKEGRHHVRPVRTTPCSTAQLIGEIELATTLTSADVKGALDALVAAMSRELRNGRTVHIDGLGTFSLSIGGSVEQKPDGHLHLSHPHVRTVLFRPEPALVRRFGSVQFSPVSHLPAGRRTFSLSEAKALAGRLLADKPFFTAGEFVAAAPVGSTTARERLRALLADGTVRNAGTSRRPIYMPA